MEADIDAKFKALEEKIDRVYISAEKTRKYLFWTMVISIAVIVLPMIGLLFALPSFFSYYGDINSLINTGNF